MSDALLIDFATCGMIIILALKGIGTILPLAALAVLIIAIRP